MSAQTSKEKLTGTKVTNMDLGRVAVVDSAENQPLYDEIDGDELVIPSGWLVILVDATDGTTVKLGNGKVWSESILISEPAPEV